MKVLLASITAGHGHHAAAAAIEGGMVRRGAEVAVLDVFKHISGVLYKMVDKGYLLSTRHTPAQYGRMYHAFESDSLMRKAVLTFMGSELLSGKLLRYLSAAQPDVVVSTHPCAGQLIDDLMARGVICPRHLCVNTDYTLLPFWETLKSIDGIVVCGRQLVYRAESRGIRPELILPLGIPVDERYCVQTPQPEARGRLGLNPEKRTVLIMSGSMGFGNMTGTVKKLADSGIDLQIICVCGRNEKLREELSARSWPVEVRVLGFVDYVDLCMDAADIVVTKPGGLSVSESLAKKKPIILTAPIPGHERDNLTCLVNYGLALHATDAMPVHELVHLLLSSPERLEMMRAAIEKYAAPNPTDKICDHICAMYEGQKGSARQTIS